MEYKKSFFERLTGTINGRDEEEDQDEEVKVLGKGNVKNKNIPVHTTPDWMEEENEEAELAVDVYQTATDIVVQTMVAGVRPEDLNISVARDIITISGKREENKNIEEENFFIKELYWGKFTRSISLPQEVEPEEVDATERHGLLTIRVQKVDREKKSSVKVKSI